MMFCEFFQSVVIEGKAYTIAVGHFEGSRLITLDNKIVAKDTEVSQSKSFYEILINQHKLTLAVYMSHDDKKLSKRFEERYELFIDNVSITTGEPIDQEKTIAYEKIKTGFYRFVQDYWKEIFKKEILNFLLTILFGTAFVFWYSWRRKIIALFIGIPIVICAGPAFVFFEYLQNRLIVRHWENQYRLRIRYEDLSDIEC